MPITVSFRLLPADADALESKSLGNKSFILRRWLKEFANNPTDLTIKDATLTRNSVTLDDKIVENLDAIATERGMSRMELVRRIVETNLAKPQ